MEIAEVRTLAGEIATFARRPGLAIRVEEGERFAEPVRPNADGGLSVSPAALRVLRPEEMRHGLARAATWHGARDEARGVQRALFWGAFVGALAGALVAPVAGWALGAALALVLGAGAILVLFRAAARRARNADLRALAATRDPVAAEGYFRAWSRWEMAGGEPVAREAPLPVDGFLRDVRAAAQELGLATSENA